MAKGNMVLTLVAQTKGFSKNIYDAAITALVGGLIMFLPNFIKMGEEARKSELRLANIAKQMGLFGDNTEKVTGRVSDLAEALSFSTGIDDEVIRNSEAILLTFKELAKSADTVGGAFDRATRATIDLAAAGFGDAESNAKQLGKALQDPVKGLTALTKSGVTFTKAERNKIKALTESGKLYEAQNIILTAIETQVGGTAEATASATDKMNAKWESVQEQLSEALLPAVDDLATAFIEWLDSVEGKTAIANLTKQLEDFGKWIASPDGKKAIDKLVGSLGLMFDVVSNLVTAVTDLAEAWGFATDQAKNYNSRFYSPNAPRSPGRTPATGNPGSTSGPTTPADRRPSGITVNVTGITPSVTVGKTVINAIKNAERVGIR
jgi:hypothetical protein